MAAAIAAVGAVGLPSASTAQERWPAQVVQVLGQGLVSEPPFVAQQTPRSRPGRDERVQPILTPPGDQTLRARSAFELSVNGYMEQYLGYSRQENEAVVGRRIRTDVKSDTEIYFNGRLALSEALTVGFRVELAGTTIPDRQIDQSFLFLQTPVGQLQLGSTSNAANKMQVSAPDVGIGINDYGDQATWIVNPTGSADDFGEGPLGSTYLTLFDRKSEKISYYTPRLAGVQLGVSYIPNSGRRSQLVPDPALGYHDGVAVGANLARKLADVDLLLAGGFLTWRPPSGSANPRPLAFSLGAKLSYQGFSVGGSFSRVTDGRGEQGLSTSRAIDGTGFDVGLAYARGPAAASLSWYHGRNRGELGIAGNDAHDTVMLSVRYELTHGVQFKTSLFRAKFTGEQPGSVDDNAGWGLVSGMVLYF